MSATSMATVRGGRRSVRARGVVPRTAPGPRGKGAKGAALSARGARQISAVASPARARGRWRARPGEGCRTSFGSATGARHDSTEDRRDVATLTLSPSARPLRPPPPRCTSRRSSTVRPPPPRDVVSLVGIPSRLGAPRRETRISPAKPRSRPPRPLRVPSAPRLSPTTPDAHPARILPESPSRRRVDRALGQVRLEAVGGHRRRSPSPPASGTAAEADKGIQTGRRALLRRLRGHGTFSNEGKSLVVQFCQARAEARLRSGYVNPSLHPDRPP